MKKSPEGIKAQPNDKDFGMAHYSDGAISRLTADHIYNHSSDFPQALTVTWSQGCDTCVELPNFFGTSLHSTRKARAQARLMTIWNFI